MKTMLSGGLERVTVGRVIDGDTFDTLDGRRVRLIGVNTPESTNRMERFGKEASIYTISKLAGKKVWLQKDVSNWDIYSRLLRIVWLEVPTNEWDEREIRSKMFNAILVLNGFAESATFPPDIKYCTYFIRYTREAQENKKGLWGSLEQG